MITQIQNSNGSLVDFSAFEGSVCTPSDDTIFSSSQLFVGTAGDIAVKFSSGEVVTFKNIANGSFLPINVVKVMATNTTATDIILLK